MKKYISFFCYIVMTIAAVSFVSCGDDDEFEGSKQEQQEEQQPQQINIYTASYSINVLDVYDVTLKIYRNGKQKDVVLSTSASSKDYDNLNKREFYRYYCASVNGEEGVDSVIAVVTAKPNLESIIAGKDKDADCDLSCRTAIKEVKKVANGDYSDYCSTPNYSRQSWGELIEKGEYYETFGELIIESRCRDLQTRFTAK